MSRRTTLPDRLSLALILGMTAFLAAFYGLADFERVLCRTSDDAFYYFQIAENIARGHGSTFDGIHPTNGYQPLWQALLVPVHAALSGLSPETLVRVHAMIQIWLLGLGSLLLFRVHARWFEPPVRLVAVALLVFLLFTRTVNGMESALLVFSLALLLWYAETREVFGRFRARTALIFGLLLGVTMLSRLDTVFLAAAICLVALGASFRPDRGRDGILRLLLIVGGATLLLAPYLAYNTVSFGSPMPMSGQLKSRFPEAAFQTQILATMGRLRQTAVLVAALWAAWGALRWMRGKELSFLQGAILAGALGVVGHATYTLVFMDNVRSWAFLPYLVFLPFGLSGALGVLFRRVGDAAPAAATALLALIALPLVAAAAAQSASRTWLADPERSWMVRAYRAAEWASSHTPADATFAMTDCGTFGFFCGRRTINLDGLVNTADYQQVMAEQRLNEYLRANSVDYLVQHALAPRDRNLRLEVSGGAANVRTGDYEETLLRYRSLLHDTFSDPIPVRREDEAYRSGRGTDTPHVLVIWAIGAR